MATTCKSVANKNRLRTDRSMTGVPKLMMNISSDSNLKQQISMFQETLV